MPLNMPLSQAEDLQTVVADLEHLNRATEADFLAVGGKLMEFHTASRALHGDIAALTALVNGEQSQNACNNLLFVRRYAEEMRARSEKGAQALQLLETAADRIRRGFSGFDRIAMSFRITAILARMEAAHLSTSQGNLKNLADDVRSCSDGIRNCVDKVLAAVADFHSHLESALPAVARFEAIQQDQLPALLAAVDGDVDVFKNRQRETARTSASLSTALEAVARDIGAVASALQFHDITRQQIEHVVAAFRDPSCSAAIVSLQKAQLENAARAFLRSTQEIDRDLQSIAQRVAEMAAAGSRINQTGNHTEKDSYLADMQRRFAAVAKTVTELESLDRATHAVVADLQRTGDGLSVAVEEVQSIERQLGHISINAVISATHIGAPGDSLKVIADAIRQLRTESSSRSGEASAALDSIADALAALVETGAAHDGIPDLQASVADLESATAKSSRAAAKVASLAETLCSDLQKSRRHLAISQLFSDTVARCCQSLHTIAARAPDYDDSLLDQDHAIERRYSMQSERDVHRAETGVAAGAPAYVEGEVEFF